MINAWRGSLGANLWVGFVQIAGYRYGGASHPDPSGDLRQAQLAALALPRVAVSTTIDTGDWNSVHPPDKQTPSHRLAAGALDQVYGRKEYADQHSPPLYAGQSLLPPIDGEEEEEEEDRSKEEGSTTTTTTTARVLVKLTRPATTTVPVWATASSTLGQPGSIPRNECLVALMPPFHNYQDCGYPRLYGHFTANGTRAVFNATATLTTPTTITVSAQVPASGFEVTASSYGRASWPMTIFFSPAGVPVLPWYAALNETRPWVPPSVTTTTAATADDDDDDMYEDGGSSASFEFDDELLRAPWP